MHTVLLLLTGAILSISTSHAGQVAPQPPDARLGLEGPIPSTEEDDAKEVAETILKDLKKEHRRRPNETVQRDAHPKAHGCVKATFTVGQLPPELARGIFKAPHEYKAWIRFSNGMPGGDKPDSAGDARGMAIKLTGVGADKPKLLGNDEKFTHDFLVSNHPVFFVRSPRDYVLFTKSKAAFFAQDLLRGSYSRKLIEETLAEPATNLFQLRYFSQTPYRFGAESERRAVKYGVFAVPCGDTPITPTQPSSHHDFLREAMIATLHDGDACFDFAVQFQKRSDTMPIEDPTILWSKDESDFIPIAKIRVSREGNDGKLGTQNKARTDFCENIAMSPWHAIAEHQPLGGTNRVRRVVYQTISKFRREANGVRPAEPTGSENF